MGVLWDDMLIGLGVVPVWGDNYPPSYHSPHTLGAMLVSLKLHLQGNNSSSLHQVLERNFKGILLLSVFLVINDNTYRLMFSLSFIWRNIPYVLLEDHVLDSSVDSMKIKIYLQDWHQDHRIEEKNQIWLRRKMLMEFICGTQFIHTLAYVLINAWSTSWEFDLKKRIQNIALSQGHDI
jgi:hypothetical protein